jgi:Family of unknown function (DUF5677)
VLAFAATMAFLNWIAATFTALFASVSGPPRPRTSDVLLRLHARACQITEEIICLLESGFADGAMARWRTMHEITAVSSLMNRHGEDLAERYIAHQIVEARGAALQYRQQQERLGQEPMTEDFAKIEDRYKAAIAINQSISKFSLCGVFE